MKEENDALRLTVGSYQDISAEMQQFKLRQQQNLSQMDLLKDQLEAAENELIQKENIVES